MRIGVGLPATVPGAPGALLVEWARLADQGPFSSLGAFDRILYDNYEPMTALAAAAAVTRRIALVTSILIAPLRNTTVLAKQAKSLNALSGGRLVLGVGLGARHDDYEVTGTEYRTRGRRLTDQLAGLRSCWEDERIGPRAIRPRDPKVLVGGSGGLAMNRLVRYGDGYIHAGGPPRAFLRGATEALAAWEAAERPGRPELWGMAYFGFAGTSEAGSAYLKDYYAFTGPFAERIAAGLLTSREEVMELLDGYQETGCDELILFPTVPDLRQLDLLLEIMAA